MTNNKRSKNTRGKTSQLQRELNRLKLDASPTPIVRRITSDQPPVTHQHRISAIVPISFPDAGSLTLTEIRSAVGTYLQMSAFSMIIKGFNFYGKVSVGDVLGSYVDYKLALSELTNAASGSDLKVSDRDYGSRGTGVSVYFPKNIRKQTAGGGNAAVTNNGSANVALMHVDVITEGDTASLAAHVKEIFNSHTLNE